ncbi:uncharacterized protein LOC125550468 [Triticum urartu]|uniref:uncharacterized protein LOC125550468 n=1 Tax=Triticum urartu TaxID=4572 RepID=UPI0020435DFF|nr:uncharacterized protein LOC125550468 [Triticum urartu]
MAMASRELGMELLALTMGARVTSSRATRALASLEDEARRTVLRPTQHDADIWRLIFFFLERSSTEEEYGSSFGRDSFWDGTWPMALRSGGMEGGRRMRWTKVCPRQRGLARGHGAWPTTCKQLSKEGGWLSWRRSVDACHQVRQQEALAGEAGSSRLHQTGGR